MFTSGLGKGIVARLKAAFLFSVVVAWPYLSPLEIYIGSRVVVRFTRAGQYLPARRKLQPEYDLQDGVYLRYY